MVNIFAWVVTGSILAAANSIYLLTSNSKTNGISALALGKTGLNSFQRLGIKNVTTTSIKVHFGDYLVLNSDNAEQPGA